MNFGFNSLTMVSVRRPYQKKLSDSKMNSDVPNHQRHFRSRFVSPSTRLIVRYDMTLIVRPGAKRVQVQRAGSKSLICAVLHGISLTSYRADRHLRSMPRRLDPSVRRSLVAQNLAAGCHLPSAAGFDNGSCPAVSPLEPVLGQ